MIYTGGAWELLKDVGLNNDVISNYSKRYEYANYIAYRILRAYNASNQTSYSTFIPKTTNNLYNCLYIDGCNSLISLDLKNVRN